MRAGHGADDVKGVFNVGDPVAHGFVERVFQGLGTGFDRHHPRTQQFHAIDILQLTLDVLAAHVHHALHAETRADGGGGHAVLPGAGFGDDAALAHALGQQSLADHVVDLVRAGVVQVFALEIDLRPAGLFGPALGMINRAWAADEMLELGMEFGQELGIVLVLGVGVDQFRQRMGQRFGDEAAAVAAEMALGVGEIVGRLE